MKIPVMCENCDVRILNPVWCGYYDKYCECYEEKGLPSGSSSGRLHIRRHCSGLGVQDDPRVSDV